MTKCSVSSCREKGTFTFPKDKKRRLLWERAIDKNFKSSSSSRLCSRHFKDEDVIKNRESYYTGLISTRRFLRPGAVPTLHLNQPSKRAREVRKILFDLESSDEESLPSEANLPDSDSPKVGDDPENKIKNNLVAKVSFEKEIESVQEYSVPIDDHPGSLNLK
ncbi:uncharacterized protein LOC103570767 [Microplitis demolitor]|uniref:uncharacterized protein LOC103570767 n=1 Tax=Microplitis demolitor TaxID=69319 RepID=UPI0004CDB648|nr:uncharacterized protein LOC103570767 [Microplitis demolitor]